MSNNQFPQGCERKRVCQVIHHYENQSEDEAVEEDETVLSEQTLMQAPTKLVLKFLNLLTNTNHNHLRLFLKQQKVNP